MANFIDTEMTPVGKYLSDERAIRVPEYQRSYAWTDDEVSQLWSDLMDSMQNQRPEYFIGPIVVKGTSGGEAELIDGQQRLSTVLGIVSAIRRAFRRNGDSERADLLSAKYFGEKDFATLKNKDKFFMNEENGSVFRDFLSREVAEDLLEKEKLKYQKKNSNFLLLQSALTINDLHNTYSGGDNFKPERSIALLRYLTENVKVLILRVQDEADAYTIFETLNDRGRSLDTLDLLKNHLFSKSKSYLPEVKEKWSAIRENLFDVDPKNRFLHHFWTSLYGRGASTTLFRAMRDQISDAAQAADFAKKLNEASRLYAALHTSTSLVWDEYAPEARKNIGTLNLLDAQQALPILLAAHSKFNIVEFSKLTRLLVVMAVRYNFIGEERTGVAANYYSDIPKKIAEGDITKTAQVFKYLRAIYPNDSSFQAAFTLKSTSDSRKARYILAEIENSLSDSEKIVNSDPELVNLEHILPKNPNQGWSPDITSISPDEHKQFANRLGNLALVPKEKNKRVGSKEFVIKKKELFSQCDQFVTTKEICEYEVWDRQAIEKRQSVLAGYAVNTWRYGDEVAEVKR